MRSLEPEASQLSPEGNPSTALSDGELWSGVRPDTGVQGRSRCEVNKNEGLEEVCWPIEGVIALKAVCTHVQGAGTQRGSERLLHHLGCFVFVL